MFEILMQFCCQAAWFPETFHYPLNNSFRPLSLSAVSELDRLFPASRRVQHRDRGQAAAQRHHERLGHRLPSLLILRLLLRADRHGNNGSLAQPPLRHVHDRDDFDQVRCLERLDYSVIGAIEKDLRSTVPLYNSVYPRTGQ